MALNEYGHPLVAGKSLAQLSRDAEVVTVAIEERVMVSGADYWRDGHRLWGVMHDANEAMQLWRDYVSLASYSFITMAVPFSNASDR